MKRLGTVGKIIFSKAGGGVGGWGGGGGECCF